MLHEGIHNLWSTPIYKTHMSQEDADLILSYCLANYNMEDPGSSDGDYKNLLDIDHPATSKLKEIAQEKFGLYIKNVFDIDLEKVEHHLYARITGSNIAHQHEVHNHRSQFTSVFYIMSDVEAGTSELVMHDPRYNANRGYTGKFFEMFNPVKHLPETGDILIFPAFVWHHVVKEPTKMRISIPVDLFILDKNFEC
jgi:hypothetical protein